ncbi:hypothetical protein S245_047958, partial [Arachis hypogaea]
GLSTFFFGYHVLFSVFLVLIIRGGGVVLLYASKYDDVKLVVNISGRYDLKTGVEERLGKDYIERIKKDGFIDVKNRSVSFNYRVAEESLMDRLGTNMHEACLNIDKDCRSEKNLVFSLLLHPSATCCTFFYCLSFVTSHLCLKQDTTLIGLTFGGYLRSK